MPGHEEAPRILIVDDEPDITGSLELGLRRYGFAVDAYNDPVEALSHVSPGKYALALFDIRMPRMNGFELFREFRKIEGRAGVCFMTAFEIYSSEFKMVFPDVEPIAVLKKPFLVKTLLGLAENSLQDWKRMRCMAEPKEAAALKPEAHRRARLGRKPTMKDQ